MVWAFCIPTEDDRRLRYPTLSTMGLWRGWGTGLLRDYRPRPLGSCLGSGFGAGWDSGLGAGAG
jgi:hypothetical protein